MSIGRIKTLEALTSSLCFFLYSMTEESLYLQVAADDGVGAQSHNLHALCRQKISKSLINPPTFGTFFIQVDAPFETIRYCGFEW